MTTHWKGMVAMLLAALTAVIVGTFWSPYWGLGAFILMVFGLFLLGMAWMRPRDGEQK